MPGREVAIARKQFDGKRDRSGILFDKLFYTKLRRKRCASQ
jgi:hypothetical protein